MTPAELEQRIDVGVAVAMDSGWLVRDGIYFVPSRMECCPLSACVLPELIGNESADVTRRTDAGSVIGRELGMSYMERISFISGFDGDTLHGARPCCVHEFYDLGVRMRAKYIEAK